MFGALSIAWFVSLSLGLIFWFLAFVVIPPLSAILWLILMFKAYRGERYKLPLQVKSPNSASTDASVPAATAASPEYNH